MQASRRVLNAVTPKWHSFFHKNELWKTNCSCANQGFLWFTDSVFCMTQRWSTARAELMDVVARFKKFDITVGDVWKGSAMGVQMYLIFNFGEIIGRGSFQGYRLGPALYEVWPDPNAPSGHH